MESRCKTCTHYVASDADPGAEHGKCVSPKFVRGYAAYFGPLAPYDMHDAVAPDGVMVEDDEGWGFYVGPDFGCVHHATSGGG